jgi:BirA family transcriptional regulator, biotin operon repressor / biotin---[acetyl-CoA-carboxylase] ligase
VSDSPLAGAVVPRLRGRFGHDYRFLAQCESTQRALPEDAPEGAVAVTDFQTAGRGRRGRDWVAPSGTSVLCSLVLRPHVASERLPELSVVAGQACAEAIGAVTGLAPTVKLPNDVLVRGAKVAGILAEASEGRVVLGIGINVHQAADELPAGIEPSATSVDLETAERVDRRDLVVELLEQLERHYDEWLHPRSSSGDVLA